MERCTIVLHCLQLPSFIRKYFYAKLTGTTVPTPRDGGIIPKRFTVMSGGSIPENKVNLRAIRRVNPIMQEFCPALSVMPVQAAEAKQHLTSALTTGVDTLAFCFGEALVFLSFFFWWQYQ